MHDEVVYDLFRYHIDEYTEEKVKKILEERQRVKYKEAIEACALQRTGAAFGAMDVEL